MPIPVHSIPVTASSATTRADAIRHFQANALSFDFTLGGSETFNGQDVVTLELRKPGVSGTDGLLATVSSAANPTGTSLTLAFTTAQMNQEVPGDEREIDAVLYGIDGTELEVIWIGRITLVAHGASLSAGSPPDTSGILLTRTQADALYATLASVAALDARIDALEAGGGGVTDHGALTGLADDDHTQYHNNARGDARYDAIGAAAAAQAASQPLDADLTTIAALDSGTATGVMATEGAGWLKRTFAQIKTSLGLVKGDVGLGNVDNTSDANKPVSTAQQTALDLKADLDSPVFTGAPVFDSTLATTFTGLGGGINVSGDPSTYLTVTGTAQFYVASGSGITLDTTSYTYGAGAAAAHRAALSLVPGTNIPSGSGTSSGTNTGDNAVNSLYSGLVSNATHTGDATGATALTVVKINGTLMSGLATGILKNTTGTGVPSIATAGTDYYNPGGTDVAVADGGTGSSTAAGAATNLGLGTTDSPAWLPLGLSIATASPNATNNVANYKVPATSGTTRTDVSIQGRGTGAFMVGPVPDSSATGGNVRGASSADLQSSRSSAAQVASGTAAFAVGNANTVSGNYSAGIGNTNTASGASCFAAGETNGVSGNYAGSIGLNNSSTGASSMTFGNTAYAPAAYAQARGYQAYSLRIGQDTFANGKFSALGDAQRGRCIMRMLTSNATQTELTLDGSAATGTSISTSNRFIIQASTVVSVDVYITAVETSSGNRAMYHRRAVIHRNSTNNTTLSGLQTVGSDYESNAAWDVTLAADDTNESLQILVTGVAATNIRWMATVDFNELTSP